MMDKKRIVQLLEVLGKGIFEKEHVLSLSLLAAVAGESIFLLGPPGTAKSMVASRLKSAFREGRSFEYLMSRFSTPDEIFGPVSISALKDEDRYVRMTEGYLPTADVVFLDEIWKAGPSIQNALLTVLNEKVYLNGKEEMRLPLKLVVAASNELPAEGENLDALWDRFLVRCVVGGIAVKELFNLMISSTVQSEVEVPDAIRLSADELHMWAEGIDAVEIPVFVFSFVHIFRRLLTTYNVSAEEKGESLFYVSDRRWKKMVHLWRTSAFLNGCSVVHLADLLLLQACVWDTPAQETVLEWLLTDALVAATEEHVGVPLLSDRLAALKEEGLDVSEMHVSFKVVKAFFYQIQSMYPGRTVLIYTNEYEALSPDQPIPFVLVADRRKTGAQILRKYEKSRHPDVFPKDLLQVVRTTTGLQVNGRKYELLREVGEGGENAVPQTEVSSRKTFSSAMAERIVAELGEVSARLEQWQKEEAEYVQTHLFLQDRQRDILKNALRRVRSDITSLEIESQELSHATGRKLS